VDTSLAGAVTSIGRYFVVVSLLPAGVFVLYAYLLVRSGAWSGAVDLAAAVDFRAQDIVPVGLVAIILALALNPLQVGVIRFFEGYWGASPLAVRLAYIRTLHHRNRIARFKQVGLADTLVESEQVLRLVRFGESQRMLASYPTNPVMVLPTRLGNVLRRYETAIGIPYGLNALTCIPRLGMVASDREVAYVENQRTQLELATRTSFLAIAAVLVTLAMTWRDGPWMLLALVPYAVAFLAYRGSVAIAHEYGTSMAVMVDLSRFALYERMRLKFPETTEQERENNRRLSKFFEFDDHPILEHDQPPPDSGAGKA
jgi:hypothetical protein